MNKKVVEVKNILKKTIKENTTDLRKDTYIEMVITNITPSGLENLLTFINGESLMKDTFGWEITPIVFMGTDNEVVNIYNERVLDRLEKIDSVLEIQSKPRIPVFKSTTKVNNSNNIQKVGMNKSLSDLIRQAQRYDDFVEGYTKHLRTDLDLDVDFQRDLVWTQEQKEILILNILREIPIGNFYVNVIDSYNKNAKNLTDIDNVLYDGKQRLTTIIEFLNGGFPINYYGEETYCSIELYQAIMGTSVTVYETGFDNKNDLIDYYIQINTSQTLHTKEEIMKALKLKK